MITFCKTIRVPYLTREQIEKEGWKFEGHGQFKDSPIGDDTFFKEIDNQDGGTMYYLQNITGVEPFQNLLIEYSIWDKRKGGYNENRSTLFDGTCKDINTFKIITKLLGINGS